MDKTQALKKLESIGQQHLLHAADWLIPSEQRQLFADIEAIDLKLFRRQQKLLHTPPPKPASFSPFTEYTMKGSEEDAALGRDLIRAGKVGALIVAGGQGTRLKDSRPKGTFPISPIKHKSLFQLFAEKTLAAGRCAGRPLSLAIMTSPLNHDPTLAFFKEHDYFGLDERQIRFFSQSLLPFLNDAGDLFLEAPHRIAMGPDGNGTALTHFIRSGLALEWQQAGIEYLNFLLVDNPLADPFDAHLIGSQCRFQADAMIKCCQRTDAKEKVGILVRENEKARVLEYTELSDEEKYALASHGGFLHSCANLSLFSFSMAFIERAAAIELPLHLAHKAVPFLKNGNACPAPDTPNAWKFEKFIFDLLPYARKTKALLYPREECFSPLKNATGDAGPEAVRQALLKRDRLQLAAITQLPSPSFPFELSQDFYYPTQALIRHWEGRPLLQPGYVPWIYLS